MDPTNTREDPKAKFRVGHHLCHGAGGQPTWSLEAGPKNLLNQQEGACCCHWLSCWTSDCVGSLNTKMQPCQLCAVCSTAKPWAFNWISFRLFTLQLPVGTLNLTFAFADFFPHFVAQQLHSCAAITEPEPNSSITSCPHCFGSSHLCGIVVLDPRGFCSFVASWRWCHHSCTVLIQNPKPIIAFSTYQNNQCYCPCQLPRRVVWHKTALKMQVQCLVHADLVTWDIIEAYILLGFCCMACRDASSSVLSLICHNDGNHHHRHDDMY